MAGRALRLGYASAAAAVACLGLVVGMPPASAAPDSTTTVAWIAFSGFSEDANTTYTPAQVQQMQAAADAAADAQTRQVESTIQEKLNSMPDGSSSAVSPDETKKDTPDGYKIYKGTKRSSYVYDSRWVTLGEDECNPGCHVYDEWETQLHEYLPGGTSTQWQLTGNIKHFAGTKDINFYYYEYYCGINVSGGNDHQCFTSHHASAAVSDGFYSVPVHVNKYFEHNSYANVEFPMLALGVDFIHTGITVNKHRGWDVCAGAPYPNTLCGSTDLGG
jgi:hypothetical protein